MAFLHHPIWMKIGSLTTQKHYTYIYAFHRYAMPFVTYTQI